MDQKKVKIKNVCPDRVQTGIAIYRDITTKNLSQLWEYIDNRLSFIRIQHNKQLPQGFSFSRRLYRAFSTDPTKYRPSSESLWRRVKKGENLPMVNPFVDLANLLSLEYMIPYGLYDLDKISGVIRIMQGTAEDFYQGIRKDVIHLDEKLMLRDDMGPFGNPSSDSLRTSTTPSTHDILQVIFFHPADPLQETIIEETHHCFLEFFSCSESDYFIHQE